MPAKQPSEAALPPANKSAGEEEIGSKPSAVKIEPDTNQAEDANKKASGSGSSPQQAEEDKAAEDSK